MYFNNKGCYFQKNSSKILGNMENIREFSVVAMLSEDKIMFPDHKLILMPIH